MAKCRPSPSGPTAGVEISRGHDETYQVWLCVQRALEEAEEQRRRQALREMEARLAEGQRRAEEERAAAEAELRRVQVCDAFDAPVNIPMAAATGLMQCVVHGGGTWADVPRGSPVLTLAKANTSTTSLSLRRRSRRRRPRGCGAGARQASLHDTGGRGWGRQCGGRASKQPCAFRLRCVGRSADGTRKRSAVGEPIATRQANLTVLIQLLTQRHSDTPCTVKHSCCDIIASICSTAGSPGAPAGARGRRCPSSAAGDGRRSGGGRQRRGPPPARCVRGPSGPGQGAPQCRGRDGDLRGVREWHRQRPWPCHAFATASHLQRYPNRRRLSHPQEFTAAAVACRALGSAAAACVPPAEARVQDRRAAAERAAREAADRGARGEARDWCAKAKALGSSVQALHRIETAAVEASRALVAELQAAARGPGFDEARWRRARASAVAAGLGRYVREEEQALAARRARVSASLRDLRAALAPASSRGLLGFAAADGAAPPLAGSVALAEEALADAARLGLAQEAALTREVLARERSRCAEGLAAAAAAGDVSAYEAAAEAAREAGVDAGALAMAQRQFGHRRAEAETAVLEAGSTGTLAAFASALRAAGPMLPGGPGSALLRAREAMAARRLRCAAALRDAAVAALQGFLPASSSRAPRECWGDEGASNSGGVKGVGSRTQDDLARAMARLRPALAEANALGLAGGIAAAVEALRAAARAREAAGAGVVAQCVLERLEGSMCRGDKCEESEDAVASRVDEMVAYEVTKHGKRSHHGALMASHLPSLVPCQPPAGACVLPQPLPRVSTPLPRCPQAQHASTRGADGVPWVSARRPMWPPAADAAAVVVGHAAFAAAQAEPGAGPPGHRAAGVINTPAPLTPALHAPSDAVATRPTSRASDASFHKDVPDNILTGQMLQERCGC